MKNRIANQPVTRRDALRWSLLAAGASLAAGNMMSLAAQLATSGSMRMRAIPKSGEEISVIGVGTNNFGVQGADEMAPIREVLRLMAENGANVIDTARVYGGGRAEEVISELLDDLALRDQMFIATKVPNPDSPEHALEMLEACMTALSVDQVGAMRAHNIAGTPILFPILREWKEAGRIRHLGVTTVNSDHYPEIERQIIEENIDMIEINYSVADRTAAERLLPVAQDNGVAVLVAVPFGGRNGNILPRVANQPLPDFASEISATSWAQLCLKYNLANPAVTSVTPGTTNPTHIIDNLAAGFGELPDADMCRRIEQIIDGV